ncbi:MAG: glycosyltransferase [Alphaproteobacteria bacterium]
MQHPRIIQVMAGADVGGAEGFFVRLTTALAAAGVPQQAAIRRHDERRRLLTGAGVDVHELPFRKWFDFSTTPGIRKLARDFEANVILAWMNRAAAAVPHGDWVTAGRLGGYYKLSNYRTCDHLIGNTPDLRDYLIREGWPEDRAWYLPNFVDDRRMPPVDRAGLDTPPDAPLVLCLGRLHRNKAFDTALHVLSKVPNAYLWLAGDGPEEQALRDLAVRLGVNDRVRFLGWRTDMAALLAAADIFLCSSRHEPLGNIVLEAWAHGVPVVAASSQGPGQLIADGETGLLAPIDDADALARNVKRLIDDPSLGIDLGGAAQAAYVGSYSEGPVVGAYMDFFDRITSHR